MKTSRRNFLKHASTGTLLTLPSVQAIVTMADTLLRGQLARAMSPDNIDPLNYVQMYFHMAPPHWILTPMMNGANGPKSYNHPSVATAFLHNPADGNQRFVYRSFRHQVGTKVFQLPHLYRASIPRVSDSPIPATDIFRKMLHLRGMTGGFNLHAGDAIRTVRPNSNGFCLPGLVAASSKRPISAVSFLYGFHESFRSPLGVSRSNLLYTAPPGRNNGAANPASELLSPFARRAEFQQILTRKDLVEDLMSIVRGNLEDRARRTIADSDQLSRYARSASQLSLSQIFTFAEDWGVLREKYWDLIQQCRDIRDLFPEPVRASAVSQDALFAQLGNVEGTLKGINAADDDLRNIFAVNAANESSENLRVKNLAESAAMIEFVLKHQLSSAVSVGIEGIAGVNARVQLASGTTNQYTQQEVGNDYHRVGVAWSTLGMSFYMKSVMACLHEINTQIPRPERTVFHLTSEFGRSAGDYSSTSASAPASARSYFSDHMWDGNWLCVYSHAVANPAVIGNIYRTRPDFMRCSGPGHPNGNKLATDGYGAPVQLEGSVPSPLLYAHGTTGIAASCGVESPTPNFHAPFERKSDGTIAPNIADGTMIEVSFSGCNPMPVEPPGDEPIASDPTGIDDPNNEVQT